MSRLNILYLTPKVLFESKYLLMQQWGSLESLIPCFLRSLYEGRLEVRLHEFDKIFSGIRNVQNPENPEEVDVLARTASLWYYLTRITHQSIGPRVGKFAEELIRRWIEESRLYKVVERDAILSTILYKHFKIQTNYRNRLDFYMEGNDKALFIELRMSEHTGGRTGQESLMDKFDKTLELVASGDLVERSLAKGLKSIGLLIAILFNEEQELIDPGRGNYNAGRLNSLISYIMEDNHVWGKINRIKNNFILCSGESIEKSRFEMALKKYREACLKHKNKDFRVYLKILLGDDFFKELLGMGLQDLIARQGNVIADDLWVMYTLTLNELKKASMFDTTHARIIYEASKSKPELRRVLEEFRELYEKCSRNPHVDERLLNRYLTRLNQIIDKMAQKTLTAFDQRRQRLELLESNDITSSYRYLRYVCASVLALYLTIDVKKDPAFSKCRWSSREED